ncbi:uncharacterized protein LOC125777856 [Bactrocera dorsalis]|uniref:Uncharacterized protein LOC125777856 n=1 Tax=Bactrocera dorsalis TaxID=27457 RepID=A0ABM3JKP8_BACDO|nr:uncharacterized protein LOC125777856 [Bactrocera dorsalis]
MADLPKERIHASRPFIVTGIDYCGPFYFKPETRKKAVWMELVKDLSTGSFLDALKRFIATRSIPSCIWSDNATNFVGAKNELKDLRENHRNQRSPHFGGLWEAAVKMAKKHFYRSVGSSLPGFEELRTLVCQISAVINPRPLVPLSENPEDLDVLTPGIFLLMVLSPLFLSRTSRI